MTLLVLALAVCPGKALAASDVLIPGMDELTDAIRQSETAFDKEKLAAFRHKFMRACDGHSTERIEQLVFGRSLR